MRAFSTKGAILRRQRDSADSVARGLLFGPGSRRNLSAGLQLAVTGTSDRTGVQSRKTSHHAARLRARTTVPDPRVSDVRAFCAASVLRAVKRTAGGSEGFLTWLKDIFNKNAEARGGHIADRASVATQPDHPEIAVPERPAGCSSRKVDVVNQLPVNFGAARSKATLEDAEHFRTLAERHAANENGIEITGDRASSPRCRVAASKEGPGTSGRDDGANSLWILASDEIHRSAGNVGEVAGRPRSYASPRHSYRVPWRQPLLGPFVLNRDVPMRAMAAFAPGNTPPPITEPNTTPEKRDEKKDERKTKHPVIPTNVAPAEASGEARAATEADNLGTGDSEAAGFRYEWGVKLTEGPASSLDSEQGDNAGEKDRGYVMKRLWGVNLRQPQPDAEDTTAAASKVPQADAGEKNETVSSIAGGETGSNEAVFAASSPVDPQDTAAKQLSTAQADRSDSVAGSAADNLLAARSEREASNASESSSYDTRKLQETIAPDGFTQTETIVVDDDYNVPADTVMDAEIAAWKNVVASSRTIVIREKEDFLSADRVENLRMVSIRPEAPQPKLDVQVVRSIEDTSKNEATDQHSDSRSVRFTAFTDTSKRPESADARKFDASLTHSKKLHTASWQIRYSHRDTGSMVQCCNDDALGLGQRWSEAKFDQGGKAREATQAGEPTRTTTTAT